MYIQAKQLDENVHMPVYKKDRDKIGVKIPFKQGERQMSKYTEPSKDLLEHIGGKENIAAVTHCVTRMRFVLNDPTKADIKEIESIKLVK